VAKERLSEEDRSRVYDNIKVTIELADVAAADFVIEAIPESLEMKIDLIQKLNQLMDKDQAILATNTSSISITKLASVYQRPERFVGMHFMNPGTILVYILYFSTCHEAR